MGGDLRLIEVTLILKKKDGCAFLMPGNSAAVLRKAKVS